MGANFSASVRRKTKNGWSITVKHCHKSNLSPSKLCLKFNHPVNHYISHLFMQQSIPFNLEEFSLRRSFVASNILQLRHWWTQTYQLHIQLCHLFSTVNNYNHFKVLNSCCHQQETNVRWQKKWLVRIFVQQTKKSNKVIDAKCGQHLLPLIIVMSANATWPAQTGGRHLLINFFTSSISCASTFFKQIQLESLQSRPHKPLQHK